MVMFSTATDYVMQLIKKRDELNRKRSAQLRAEGAGVCLDKDYRLLCKEINKLSAEINKLAHRTDVKL